MIYARNATAMAVCQVCSSEWTYYVAASEPYTMDERFAQVENNLRAPF